jgi:1-phosphofructokinase family hexose kinase
MIYTLTLNPAVDLEYTVQELIKNEVLRAPAVRKDFGGKGFNVSRMLNVLGVESTALGFVGGQNGKALEEGLHSLGIRTDFIWTSGETRANTSIVAQRDGDYIKVNEPGPTISPEEQDKLLSRVGELAVEGDWWVLAGSLPPGVPANIYAQLTHKIQEAGAWVIVDTSGAALEASLPGKPFLIKPNANEAGTLTGLPIETTAEIAVAAEAILRQGAENVVVSLGKDGALLASPNQILLGKPPKIQEQNPIGAGDAMVAGLVYRLSIQQPLDDALQWGLACGATAASQAGTHMGTREIVKKYLEDTHIKEFHYES